MIPAYFLAGRCFVSGLVGYEAEVMEWKWKVLRKNVFFVAFAVPQFSKRGSGGWG